MTEPKPNIYVPKLSVEITEAQSIALQNFPLHHGWRKAVFGAIIDDLILLHDEKGVEAIALIGCNKAKPSECLPILNPKYKV